MIDRWRGRRSGLAILLAATAIVAGCGGAAPSGSLSIRDGSDGSLLVRVPLGPDDSFALRYRNSLYGTLAEERFVVRGDGQLELVMLAADQLAVLEEYYAIDEPAWRAPADDRRAWLASPASAVTLRELAVAATELGERTLIVPGASPLALWQLEEADPTVVIEAEH